MMIRIKIKIILTVIMMAIHDETKSKLANL